MSGRVQMAFGFSPIFLVTASLYSISILMMYFFFRRTQEIQVPKDREDLLLDEEHRV